MNAIFSALADHAALDRGLAAALEESGFIVVQGPSSRGAMSRLRAAYDTAAANAAAADVGVGRTTTRINDFVNRGAEFDDVYTFPLVLDACCHVIGRPFRLSAMHARTLRAGASAQELHADISRRSDAWPMVGVILMVDDFRVDNGATRFVPGSHQWPSGPEDIVRDRHEPYPGEVFACGPAGSLIIFNASIWHGHTANTSGMPRRSIQATFIPRDGKAAVDWPARMQPETLARISPVARYVILSLTKQY